MIALRGIEIPSLPISGLHKVRDLDAFDGPLLSHFRHPSGDDYLYYWCDCNDSANRWMVLRVTERNILRLANRVVPLDYVIPTGAKDDFVYFVDLDGNGRAARVLLVIKENVPADYTPQGGARLPSRVLGDDGSYTILVEGPLSLDELFELPTKYSQAYSLQYTLATLRPDGFEAFPWRGGFSSMHFYRDIAKKLPAEAKPALDAVQIASPGFIRFVMDRRTASLVTEAVGRFLDAKSAANLAYDRLRLYIRAEKLNDLREKNKDLRSHEWAEHDAKLIDFTRSLIEAMQVIGGEILSSAAEAPFESAKITMSYAHRLRELAHFANAGQIIFPE
ncbi:MAG TPA: hypothetical protein VNH11_33725 [Pirellulales bacterium]|nr:hypothetical protein [Pirellulales bacterium]